MRCESVVLEVCDIYGRCEGDVSVVSGRAAPGALPVCWESYATFV